MNRRLIFVIAAQGRNRIALAIGAERVCYRRFEEAPGSVLAKNSTSKAECVALICPTQGIP